MTKRISRRSFLSRSLSTAGIVSVSPVWGIPPANRTADLKLRFAVASDGHFGQPETNFQLFHQQMISWLNQENAGKGLDFVVFNGDLIHDEPEFLPQVKALYDRLEFPYFVTKGNHDRVSAESWEDTWGYPENHEVEFGEAAILLGTTSNEKGEYLCANLRWLKKSFARFRKKAHLFVFLHISQHPVTRHGVSCPSVNRLLEEQPNVRAVFHGHDHDLDHVIYSNSRAYLFDGHMGGSWGTNYRGYRIVEVPAEGRIRTYQCNPEAFYVNGITL